MMAAMGEEAMANSYMVSVLLVASVPSRRRLEHLIVAAGSPEDAERLAHAIVAKHPDLAGFQVDLARVSELPPAPVGPHNADVVERLVPPVPSRPTPAHGVSHGL